MRLGAWFICSGIGLLLAMPAHAQTGAPSEADSVQAIEAGVDAGTSVAGVLGRSQKLAADQDLSAAASTLEAFLLVNGEAAAVRAEYAITLCRLDDMQAAMFEAAKLASMKPDPSLTAAVRAACGPLPDPVALANSRSAQP